MKDVLEMWRSKIDVADDMGTVIPFICKLKALLNGKASTMKNNEKKYMTADEARIASEIGKENDAKEKAMFSNISDEEFENEVRKHVDACLERYIPSATKRGDNYELIVPAHYKTTNDDQNRINRAKEIVEEIVAPYGYTVGWYWGTNMIIINW